MERFRETKRRRFVTPDEMPQLARAIDDETDEYVRHALWMLLLTGLRRGELLNAKWTDIDWEQRTLLIPKTKNGEALLAPLSRAAVTRLKSVPQLQGNPYIFCGHKTGQHFVNLTHAWSRVRSAADLNDLRIHDLRRTVGSWLVRDGASLHLVGTVLNHKDQKTTAGYEPSRNGSAYPMSASPRPAGGRTYQLPTAVTGRELPPVSRAASKLCRRFAPDAAM